MSSAGVRVVKAFQLSGETAQTSNLPRRSGVSQQTTGAKAIWMGRATSAPGKDSGVHHHGEAETAVYILSGHARIYYGEDFGEYVDLGPGDFMYVAPYAPHIERNLSQSEPVESLAARTPDNIVVNLDITLDMSNHQATEGTGNEQVRVVRASQLTAATAQTANLPGPAGVCKDTTGAGRIWMGRATGAPGTNSGAHHHGEAETASFILSGTTRIYFGEEYREYVDLGPGDFVYVPAGVVHIERNMSKTAPVEIVTVGTPDNIVINLDASVEMPD